MEVITRHFINKCKWKASYLKPPPKNSYWGNAFPLWRIQHVSWLWLARCSPWFVETSWFFSPQSLPIWQRSTGTQSSVQARPSMRMAASVLWWTACSCIHFGFQIHTMLFYSESLLVPDIDGSLLWEWHVCFVLLEGHNSCWVLLV